MKTDGGQTHLVPAPVDGMATNLSTKELLGRIVEESKALVRNEIELARAELMADLKAEARVAKGLGAGAILGLCGLNLALVTVLPAWAAGLIVMGVVLAVAGIVAAVAWSRRVRTPLERTRKHLKDDARWMKEKLV
jgi:hypothetical protein